MNELLWYGTRSAGLVSVVLLTATFVLGALTGGKAPAVLLPAFVRTALHRTLALVTVSFVAVHVVAAIAESYVDIGWPSLLVPFSSGYSRFWVGLGTVTLDLLLAVIVASLLRQRMPQRAWRAVHWSAYALWPVALLHGVGTSTSDQTLVTVTAISCGAIGLAAVGWRLLRTSADTSRRRLAAAHAWR